jgi:MoaA/NifB/PqqE/SkfB family radical SAM enzyme
VTAQPWISAETGQPMRRLEFHVTYTCPEACQFCSEEHRMQSYRQFPVTLARAKRVLREQRARGVESVHFTGGEPTIHPQFVEILRFAKALGLRTSIGTIGTRLADSDWAARAMPFLDEALFSLHGPDAATHDALTSRPGSFDRVTTAMAHAQAARPGFRPFVNTVVTRHNVGVLPATVATARAHGASLVVISNLTPEGSGLDAYDALHVRLSELSAQLPAVVEAAGDTIVRVFGVPACVLGAHRMLSNDLHWNARVTVEWATHPGRVSLEGLYSWHPDRKRAHGPACEACSWRAMCPGAFAAYLERHGDAELRAVSA